ncbi:MAG: sporulation transcriptional regulator SpoIIID [Lachnospiraceae bacterium]|nr:sporulation transcriptional regulator SpoIIID [Lachnospiraceae bacterium]
MRDYIEERALEIGEYIIEEGATVRQAARKFGISKSTVHIVDLGSSGDLTRNSRSRYHQLRFRIPDFRSGESGITASFCFPHLSAL